MSQNQQILLEMTKVPAAAAAAGVISLSNINVILTTISICLAICYTIWKWIKDYKKG